MNHMLTHLILIRLHICVKIYPLKIDRLIQRMEWNSVSHFNCPPWFLFTIFFDHINYSLFVSLIVFYNAIEFHKLEIMFYAIVDNVICVLHPLPEDGVVQLEDTLALERSHFLVEGRDRVDPLRCDKLVHIITIILVTNQEQLLSRFEEAGKNVDFVVHFVIIAV